MVTWSPGRKTSKEFQRKADAALKDDETDIDTTESSDNDEDGRDESRESVEEIRTYLQDLLDDESEAQARKTVKQKWRRQRQ